MVLNFSELKISSQNSLTELATQIAKLTTPQYKDKDDRFWQPEVDKSGNGYAVIRFLPSPKGENLPYVRIYRHSFKGPTGAWYIENSLTTKGLPDPLAEYNSKLWATGTKENQDLVRKQSRKVSFISNIQVIREPLHPENDGKLFLYRYGKKIFTKMNNIMNPTISDEPRMNPFDPWNGPEFKLKIRTVSEFRNYDESVFGEPKPLGDDETIEKIWLQEHSLNAFLDDSNFKSYQELKERMDKVLGLMFKTDIPFDLPPNTSSQKVPASLPVIDDDDDGGEDRIDFFQKLAKED